MDLVYDYLLNDENKDDILSHIEKKFNDTYIFYADYRQCKLNELRTTIYHYLFVNESSTICIFR